MSSRRPGFAPGTSLLLPADLIDYVVDFAQFSQDTGFEGSELVSSPVLSTPLPPVGTTARRWPAEMLWHPLAWLPERLAEPMTFEGQLEPIDGWLMRVGFEMQETGCYDPETGTWFDILDYLGIDAEADRERLLSWKSGDPDEVLDDFDLDDLIFQIDDPEWSLDAAITMLEPVQLIARGRTGEQLREIVSDAIISPELSFEDKVSLLVMTCALGQWLVGDDAEMSSYFERTSTQLRDVDEERLSDVGSPATRLAETFAGFVVDAEPVEREMKDQFDSARKAAGLENSPLGWDTDLPASS